MPPIRFGPRTLDFPSADLAELRDANDLLDDPDALRRRMHTDGYLLLRRLIDPDRVRAARARVLQHMDEHHNLVPGQPLLEGVMPQGGKTVGMMGRRGITQEPTLRRVFESEQLFAFWQNYFGRDALTFDYKWLRAVGNERFTGAHYDVVYMGRGSGNLHTCWIPLGDIDPVLGSLAVCVGSNHLPGFEKLRQTYGRSDVDRDRTEGWFSKDPMEIAEAFGGQWATTTFAPGDVLTFGMFTMHASTTNLTNRYRLSADVRFQPADDPVDPRWGGDNPTGHNARPSNPGSTIPIAIARAAWGV